MIFEDLMGCPVRPDYSGVLIRCDWIEYFLPKRNQAEAEGARSAVRGYAAVYWRAVVDQAA